MLPGVKLVQQAILKEKIADLKVIGAKNRQLGLEIN